MSIHQKEPDSISSDELTEYAIAWIRRDLTTCKSLSDKYPRVNFKNMISTLVAEYSINEEN